MYTKSAFAPKAFSAIILVMVIVQIVPTGSAGGEINWYLRRDDANGFTHPSHNADKMMETSKSTYSNSQSIVLQPGQEAWWYAGLAAENSVEFAQGSWRVSLWIDIESGDKQKTVNSSIWILSSGGSAAFLANSDYAVSSASGQKFNWSIPADSFILESGDRLALSFKWSSGAVFNATLKYDSYSIDCNITSPATVPSYPTPELPSVILFISGIAIAPLIAFAGRKRR
jgi:hypothetical protein